MPTIKLQSSDGEIIEADAEIAMVSVTVKTMLERLGMGGEGTVIPVPSIRSAILQKIVDWVTYHKNHPMPMKMRQRLKRTCTMSQWDADFFRVDHSTLLELTLAANCLNIRGLLDLSCRAIACMMQDKTAEEIREAFNIKNDFAPDEEEEVRKEIEKCNEFSGWRPSSASSHKDLDE